MKPSIVEKPAFLVVGVRTLWNLDPAVPEKLWVEQFLPHRQKINAAPGTSNSAFGVFNRIPDMHERMFEYVAGMMVPSLEDIPPGMVGWEIPDGTYASATIRGIENIYSAYCDIMESWLPTSEFTLIDGPVFTISSNLANPADPTAFWQVNVHVKGQHKNDLKSEVAAWKL
jgi:predicted transcriptional regulator YdeE